MKIVEMRRMLTSELFFPSKWAGQAVMANCMHRQGHNGRPRKNLTFFTSDSGSPKKCAIAHENRQNEVYTRFGTRLTLQIGRTSRDGKQDA